MLAKQHTDKKRRSFSQQQEFFFDGKSIQNLIFLKRILVQTGLFFLFGFTKRSSIRWWMMSKWSRCMHACMLYTHDAGSIACTLVEFVYMAHTTFWDQGLPEHTTEEKGVDRHTDIQTDDTTTMAPPPTNLFWNPSLLNLVPRISLYIYISWFHDDKWWLL